ncbi:hypothetical protein [Actinoplanes regularis]|uniref:Uncharacterized protein n=1 Tax=Actinoplanes regularis TaxID=52697 RepID=A0A239I6Z3_9ACTN|nr:hypothetical protein [Actinoplanes regularis]GIE91315.1 hypothetical protein Are01nite_77950 [Actinoplanes regularis]SNS89317.1 hypothetical protein SAMN06264365_127117 [Actinoplanes regularis]
MTNHEDAGPRAATDDSPVTVTVAEPVITLCGAGSCPTVYRTDRGTVLVQGVAATGVAVADGELLVEIPRELLIEAARQIQEQDV